MKTLAKYHAWNHCIIGEKTFKNTLIGPGKLPGLLRNGPLIRALGFPFSKYDQVGLCPSYPPTLPSPPSSCRKLSLGQRIDVHLFQGAGTVLSISVCYQPAVLPRPFPCPHAPLGQVQPRLSKSSFPVRCPTFRYKHRTLATR